MSELRNAPEPFRFYTRLHLSELTGLRATTLTELLELMKTVPGSSIYHHTHRFLQQHQYLSPEPPNDFAYWVSQVVGENELGERLASVDVIQFDTIRALRGRFVELMEAYLQKNPTVQKRFVSPGEEFHFMKSVSFVLPTPRVASNLKEFVEILKKITLDSIYFHIFEARLRLEKTNNDFSFWIEHSLGDKGLAENIARLDPYTQTLEDLRRTVIRLSQRRL